MKFYVRAQHKALGITLSRRLAVYKGQASAIGHFNVWTRSASLFIGDTRRVGLTQSNDGWSISLPLVGYRRIR